MVSSGKSIIMKGMIPGIYRFLLDFQLSLVFDSAFLETVDSPLTKHKNLEPAFLK